MDEATRQRARMLAEHFAQNRRHGFHPDDCSACWGELRMVVLGLEAELRAAPRVE